MLRSQNSIVINRSIADVYQFVAVDFFANYQKWSPEVCELEQLTGGGMRVGATGRQVRCDHGYRSEAYFRVTQMIPLRYLHFASLSKPDFEVRYMFEPVAGATRLTFDFQLSPPLTMLPFRRLVQYAITQGALRTVTNLQTILQADGEASTTGSTQGTVTS